MAADSLEDTDQALKASLSNTPAAAAAAASPPASGASERLRFFSAAPGGESGLLNVMEAGSGKPLTFRLSLHGGLFQSATFLKTDPNWQDYSESQQIFRAGLAMTVLPFLEVFANLRNSSNQNTASRPSLLQTQGDLEFGVKGYYAVIPSLSLGADLAVNFMNGIGDSSPDFSGTGARAAFLASFDVRKIEPRVPLRLHLNAGMIFENGDNLAGDRALTHIETYALRVNRFHRVALGFALDAPLPYADPVAIQPFLEYSMQIPVGVGRDDLDGASMGTDTTLANVIGMRLTPGVRVTYLDDITLDVAVDIGIGGEKAYLNGVPAVPPYMVWIGLAYAFDPFVKAETRVIEKPVEKIVEKTIPAPVTTGRVAGRVLNASDQSIIPEAIVSFEGGVITPVASDALEGRYATYDLTAGMVKLTASKQGFKPQTQEAEVKAGEMTLLDFALEPEIQKGTLSGTVQNEAEKPMAARVEISGPMELKLESAAETGAFSTELPPGTYTVKVSAERYLTKARTLEIKTGQSFHAEFRLTPAPKQKIVVIEKNRIVLQKKIHFETAKATIARDSFAILDSVVDVLANHPEIRKVRIEGHTDSQGSLALNRRLSAERAQAVRDYLIQQGVVPERLESQGFGPDRPIAPNNTIRGRELNRRVEFVILEQ
jgi:outer membrane protein OmpA-like peptidoglycan-associated protein